MSRTGRPVPANLSISNLNGQAQSPRGKSHQVHFMAGSLPNSASSSRAQTPALQAHEFEPQSASSAHSNASRSMSSSLQMGFNPGFNPRSLTEQSPLSQSIPQFTSGSYQSGSTLNNPFAQPARARQASGAHHHPYSRSGTSTPLEPPSPWEVNGTDFPFGMNQDDANAIAMALAGQQVAQGQGYGDGGFGGSHQSSTRPGTADAAQLLGQFGQAMNEYTQHPSNGSRLSNSGRGSLDPPQQGMMTDETQRIMLENALLRNMLAGNGDSSWNGANTLQGESQSKGRGVNTVMDSSTPSSHRNVRASQSNNHQHPQLDLSAAEVDAILRHESFGQSSEPNDPSEAFFSSLTGMMKNMQEQQHEASGANDLAAYGRSVPGASSQSGQQSVSDTNLYDTPFGSGSASASTPSLLTQRLQQGQLSTSGSARSANLSVDHFSASLPNGTRMSQSQSSSTGQRMNGHSKGILPTPPASFSQSFAYPPGQLPNQAAAGWGPNRGVQEKRERGAPGLSLSATAASRNLGMYTPLITPTALVENLSLASPTTPVSLAVSRPFMSLTFVIHYCRDTAFPSRINPVRPGRSLQHQVLRLAYRGIKPPSQRISRHLGCHRHQPVHKYRHSIRHRSLRPRPSICRSCPLAYNWKIWPNSGMLDWKWLFVWECKWGCSLARATDNQANRHPASRKLQVCPRRKSLRSSRIR